jgi:mono/diheme cytochrome c family protein
MKSYAILALSFSLVISVASGCGGRQSESAPGGEAGGLTAEQMENGVGPVTTVTLGEIDPELAEKGKATFELKCSACHKLDERYVGPALGDVLTRRTPAYVMNMILNPEGMLSEHPEAKKLLSEYMTPMANQNLTEDEARSVVEYFRTTSVAMDEESGAAVDGPGGESD